MTHASERCFSDIQAEGLTWREVPVEIVYTPSRRGGQSVWNSVNIFFDLCVERSVDDSPQLILVSAVALIILVSVKNRRSQTNAGPPVDIPRSRRHCHHRDPPARIGSNGSRNLSVGQG